jgi:hypothetical protein
MRSKGLMSILPWLKLMVNLVLVLILPTGTTYDPSLCNCPLTGAIMAAAIDEGRTKSVVPVSMIANHQP